MDKQIATYTHSEILLGLEKEDKYGIYYGTHEPEDIILNEINQLQKRQILCDYTYTRFIEYSKSQRQRVTWWFLQSGRRQGESGVII
jgi:hypothetical protein